MFRQLSPSTITSTPRMTAEIRGQPHQCSDCPPLIYVSNLIDERRFHRYRDTVLDGIQRYQTA